MQSNMSSAEIFDACSKGDVTRMTYLLDYILDPNRYCGKYKDHKFRKTHICTPLWLASALGHGELVILLLKEKADIDIVSDTGLTPLMIACLEGRFDIAEDLLKSKANVHQQDCEGRTCLFYALGNVVFCKYLVEECGAEVNVQDEEQYTPLMYAMEMGCSDSALYLLPISDLSLRNDRGEDALLYACIYGSASYGNAIINLIDQGRLVGTQASHCRVYELLAARYYRMQISHTACNYLKKAFNCRTPEETLMKKRFKSVLFPESKEPSDMMETELAFKDSLETAKMFVNIMERLQGRYAYIIWTYVTRIIMRFRTMEPQTCKILSDITTKSLRSCAGSASWRLSTMSDVVVTFWAIFNVYKSSGTVEELPRELVMQYFRSLVNLALVNFQRQPNPPVYKMTSELHDRIIYASIMYIELILRLGVESEADDELCDLMEQLNVLDTSDGRLYDYLSGEIKPLKLPTIEWQCFEANVLGRIKCKERFQKVEDHSKDEPSTQLRSKPLGEQRRPLSSGEEIFEGRLRDIEAKVTKLETQLSRHDAEVLSDSEHQPRDQPPPSVTMPPTAKSTPPKLVFMNDVLRPHYVTLVNTIESSYIIPYLYSKLLINRFEKEEIEAIQSPAMRNTKLIDALGRRPIDQLSVLITILKETNYEHLASLLYNEESDK